MVGFRLRLAVYRARLWLKRRKPAKSFTMPKVNKDQVHSTVAVTAVSAAVSISVIGSKMAAIGAPLAMGPLCAVGLVIGVACGAFWTTLPSSKKPLTKEDLSDLSDIIFSTRLRPTGRSADLMEMAYETIMSRKFVESDHGVVEEEDDKFPTSISKLKEAEETDRNTESTSPFKRTFSGNTDIDDDDDDDLVGTESSKSERDRWLSRQYNEPSLADRLKGTKYAKPFKPSLSCNS